MSSEIEDMHKNIPTFVENKEHIRREYRNAVLDDIINLNSLAINENKFKYFHIINEDCEIIPLGEINVVEYLNKKGFKILKKKIKNKETKEQIMYVSVKFKNGFNKIYEVEVCKDLNIGNRYLGEIFVYKNAGRVIQF